MEPLTLRLTLSKLKTWCELLFLMTALGAQQELVAWYVTPMTLQ